MWDFRYKVANIPRNMHSPPLPHTKKSWKLVGPLQMINEQTFSRQCWPEPGVCFTFIVLCTSGQSQKAMTTFTKSGNKAWLLSDICLLQSNSYNTRLRGSLASAFLSRWWHQQVPSQIPVQPSLPITVNSINFWRPPKNHEFSHFQEITTRL